MDEPLFLQPSFHTRIWGGRKLDSVLGYEGLPAGPVGECWGISAHPNGPSVVKNGPHAGKTLNEVWTESPDFFGTDVDGEFPLLVKLLDARDWLSVQVHPNDEEAVELEGVPRGKTECWYVVDADPGAEIIIGHTAKDVAAMRAAMDESEWDSLLLHRHVSPGDFFYVPSGTIHSIGPGLLICEVQQNCDTTYRVFDFDRRDADGNARELHLDKAKAVSTAPYDPSTTDTARDAVDVPGGRRRELVAGEFFTVTHHRVTGDGYRITGSGFGLLTVIAGEGRLVCDGKDHRVVAGDHIVTPARCSLLELSGDLELIGSVPT